MAPAPARGGYHQTSGDEQRDKDSMTHHGAEAELSFANEADAETDAHGRPSRRDGAGPIMLVEVRVLNYARHRTTHPARAA